VEVIGLDARSFVAYEPEFASRDQELAQLLGADPTLTQESIRLFGRAVPQPRLTTWYGIEMDITTRYRTVRRVGRFPPALEELRGACEAAARLAADELAPSTAARSELGVEFNSVLVNHYRDGNDCVAWHADDEPALGQNPIIASVSFGVTRRFAIKPRRPGTGPQLSLALHDGDLLIMGGDLQHRYLHSLRRQRVVAEHRTNLTFRRYDLGRVPTTEIPGHARQRSPDGGRPTVAEKIPTKSAHRAPDAPSVLHT
jgi:alkylated DNA repair dioxygenase AlkB